MSTPPPPPPPGSVPPPPPGFGGVPGYGGPSGYGATPVSNNASWGIRLAAFLIDFAVSVGFQLPGLLIGAASSGLGTLVQLAGTVAFVFLWSKMVGTTGQSWGKKVMKIKVVDADSGQFIGQGRAVGRYFAQILSAIPCYLGFLWPLWDQKKQTWHDKIVRTSVVTG